VGLSDAVKAGRLVGLEALRDRLAGEIETCESSRDVAALSLRLMDILAQLEEIGKAQPEEKGSPLDELAKRRSGRPASPTTRTGSGR
jgi:hypothetical protein